MSEMLRLAISGNFGSQTQILTQQQRVNDRNQQAELVPNEIVRVISVKKADRLCPGFRRRLGPDDGITLMVPKKVVRSVPPTQHALSRQHLRSRLLCLFHLIHNGSQVLQGPGGQHTPRKSIFRETPPGYHNNEKTGYHIPSVPIGDPANRKLKAITVGAGLAGIMLAYNIEKHCPNVVHIIYEKNPTVGGTWVSSFSRSSLAQVPGIVPPSTLTRIKLVPKPVS
ncbi:hypothetical protein MPH_07528 [Macrophomina phaseolina MS6]|uniref:Uncharacterized protein n=1 Tax=Macrophomina phaseolina (strain MS6) TaxID=1126212 RepID=K2RYJ8_MACPH|nr:hypothetical protein MPH_07528 [Macrophomina phaseolina MS6]